MTENQLSKIIIGCAIEVHKELGPGLLEAVYETCLYKELVEKGLQVKKQFALPVIYKGKECDLGYRLDLFVENKVIIELKSVDSLNNIHLAQTLTYLKLSNIKLGLLINFNVTKLVNGINRVVNNLHE